ncbi:MAG: helix-turn-helix domain-containing protein [bacterium]|nr:helix-turn-helix domain-containing protein [bacterium]
MRKAREKAILLRKSGASYKKISRELGIATSTLAGWFKNEPWSQKIKASLSAQVSWANPKALELLVHANRERWKNKHEEYRTQAIKEFQKYKSNPLFLSGIMLYWGEGEKQPKSSVVRLSNSDPEMIRIFNLFLTKVLKISPDKIFAWLLLYPDLVDSVQKNSWSKTTGLSTNQFKKSIYIKGRHPSKRLSYGVCTIFVSSRALKERMLKWIELCQDLLRAQAHLLKND